MHNNAAVMQIDNPQALHEASKLLTKGRSADSVNDRFEFSNHSRDVQYLNEISQYRKSSSIYATIIIYRYSKFSKHTCNKRKSNKYPL